LQKKKQQTINFKRSTGGNKEKGKKIRGFGVLWGGKNLVLCAGEKKDLRVQSLGWD